MLRGNETQKPHDVSAPETQRGGKRKRAGTPALRLQYGRIEKRLAASHLTSSFHRSIFTLQFKSPTIPKAVAAYFRLKWREQITAEKACPEYMREYGVCFNNKPAKSRMIHVTSWNPQGNVNFLFRLDWARSDTNRL
eukprot:1176003-Prorocentrum_minimum.AAC.3